MESGSLIRTLNQLAQRISKGSKQVQENTLEELREVMLEYVSHVCSDDDVKPLHRAIGTDNCSNLIAVILDHYVKPKSLPDKKSKRAATSGETIGKAHYWLRFFVDTLHRGVACDEFCQPLSWKRSRIIPYVLEYLLRHMEESEMWNMTCIDDAMNMQKLLSTQVYLAALSVGTAESLVSAIDAKIGHSSESEELGWEKMPSKAVVPLCTCVRMIVATHVFSQRTTSGLWHNVMRTAHLTQRKYMSHMTIPIMVEFVNILCALVVSVDTETIVHESFNEFMKELVQAWGSTTKDSWRMAVIKFFRSVFHRFRMVDAESETDALLSTPFEETLRIVNCFIGSCCRHPENILHTTSWKEMHAHRFEQIDDLTCLIVDVLKHRSRSKSFANQMPLSDLELFLEPREDPNPLAVWIVLRWFESDPKQFFVNSAIGKCVVTLLIHEWECSLASARESLAVIQSLMNVRNTEESHEFHEAKSVLVTEVLMPSVDKLRRNFGSTVFQELCAILMLDYVRCEQTCSAAGQNELPEAQNLLDAYRVFFAQFDLNEFIPNHIDLDGDPKSFGTLLLPYALCRGVDLSSVYEPHILGLIGKCTKDRSQLSAAYLAYHVCWKNGMCGTSQFIASISHLTEKVFEQASLSRQADSPICFLHFFFEWYGMLGNTKWEMNVLSRQWQEALVELFVECAEMATESDRKLTSQFFSACRNKKAFFHQLRYSLPSLLSDKVESQLKVTLASAVRQFSTIPSSASSEEFELWINLMEELLDLCHQWGGDHTPKAETQLELYKKVQSMDLSGNNSENSTFLLTPKLFTLLFRLAAGAPGLLNSMQTEFLKIFDSHTASMILPVSTVIRSLPKQSIPEIESVLRAFAGVLQGVLGGAQSLITPDRDQIAEMCQCAEHILRSGLSSDTSEICMDFLAWASWHSDFTVHAASLAVVPRLVRHERLLRRVIAPVASQTVLRNGKRMREVSSEAESDFTAPHAFAILRAMVQTEHIPIRAECIEALIFLATFYRDSLPVHANIVRCLQSLAGVIIDVLDILLVHAKHWKRECVGLLYDLVAESNEHSRILDGKLIFAHFISEENLGIVEDSSLFNVKKEVMEECFASVIAHTIAYHTASDDCSQRARQAIERFKRHPPRDSFSEMLAKNTVAISIHLMNLSLVRSVGRISSDDRHMDGAGEMYSRGMGVLREMWERNFPQLSIAIHEINSVTHLLQKQSDSSASNKESALSLVRAVILQADTMNHLPSAILKAIFRAYVTMILSSTTVSEANAVCRSAVGWLTVRVKNSPMMGYEFVEIGERYVEMLERKIMAEHSVYDTARDRNPLGSQRRNLAELVNETCRIFSIERMSSATIPAVLSGGVARHVGRLHLEETFRLLEQYVNAPNPVENVEAKSLGTLTSLLWGIFSNHASDHALQYLCIQSISQLWAADSTTVVSEIENFEQDLLAAEPFRIQRRVQTDVHSRPAESIESALLNCAIHRILHDSMYGTNSTFAAGAVLAHFVRNFRDDMKKALSADLFDELLEYGDADADFCMKAEYALTDNRSAFEQWTCAFVPSLIKKVLPASDAFHLMQGLCGVHVGLARVALLYSLVKSVDEPPSTREWISSTVTETLENTQCDSEIIRTLVRCVLFVQFKVVIPRFVSKTTEKKSSRPPQGQRGAIAARATLAFDIPLKILLDSCMRVNMPYEGLFFFESTYATRSFPKLSTELTADMRSTLTSIFSQLGKHGKHFLPCLSLGRTPEGRVAALQNRGDFLRSSVLIDAHMKSGGNRESLYQQLRRNLYHMNLRQMLTIENESKTGRTNETASNVPLHLEGFAEHAVWSQSQWTHQNDTPASFHPSVGFHGCIHGALTAIRANDADLLSFSRNKAKNVLLARFDIHREHSVQIANVFLIEFLQKAWDTRQVESSPISYQQLCHFIPPSLTVDYTIREKIDDLSIAMCEIFCQAESANHTAACALRAAQRGQSFKALSLVQKAEDQSGATRDIPFALTIAKTFWKIGECDFALDTLAAEVESPECAFRVAKWKCKAKRESVTRTLEETLQPLARQMNSARAHFTCAVYQDEIYASIRKLVTSAAHQDSRTNIDLHTRRRDEHHADFRRVKDDMSHAKKQNVQRLMYMHDRELKRTWLEIDQTSRDFDSYCTRTVRSYGEVLRQGGLSNSKMLTAVYRFVSIWLENSNSSELMKCIAGILPHLPTHHFIELFPQICARLSVPSDYSSAQTSGLDEFQVILRAFVKRIIKDHPNPTLSTLFALANGARFPKDEDVHTVDRSKVTASGTLLREILREAKESDDHLSRTIVGTNVLIEAYIELAFSTMGGKDNTITPKLAAIRDLPDVGVITTLDANERVYRFDEGVSLPGGINLPKLIRCISQTGKIHKQLVKSKDDLRQDALVQQVFGLCNAIFEQSLDVSIRVYRVLPLTKTSGVVEWVENTMPMSDYLTGPSGLEWQGAHHRYYPGDMKHSQARTRMRSVAKEPLNTKLTTYRAVCDSFTPCFRNFFIENFSSPVSAYKKRMQYTMSVAATSIVGYVIGLGDRHSSNILIDRNSGELIHIDIGLAFDEGMLLPVPELVPFRLTRDVVDAMGCTGTEGLFRGTCEAVLQRLRGARKMLNTVIDTLLHDPLAKWSVDYHRIFKRKEIDGNSDGGAIKQSLDAEKAAMKVNDKLLGVVMGESLSCQAHVQVLIREATSESLLCQMFDGWSSWV
ncbi:serine-protein kinase ATM-like protein [Perkinsela sp. CCAP 1560/4]|nr:serine-protein kinase ATM-like protein [Perkinsela sp. CCAP 1560/4]|eukprot:KNH07503.1 serine-protein kinase ATM-like protein [Perkinsela sp. CCAP 1560/4]